MITGKYTKDPEYLKGVDQAHDGCKWTPDKYTCQKPGPFRDPLPRAAALQFRLKVLIWFRKHVGTVLL